MDTVQPVQPVAVLGSLQHSSHVTISEASGNYCNTSFHRSYRHLNGLSGSDSQSGHNHSHSLHRVHSRFQSVSTSLIPQHEALRSGRYSCPICFKAFSEKGNMKRHTLIHLPQRHRYQCDLCTKGFSWKDNFNRHRRSHHI